MSTQLEKNTQTFNFNGIDLTVILNEKNEVFFIGKEVSDILGFRSASDAVRYLDEDEKFLRLIHVGNKKRETNIITESGLYSLILKSKKEEAKVFKKWVTSEVLPSIRKHGAYMTPTTIESLIENPDLIIQLATTLKEEKAKVLELSKTIEVQKPKVEFADAVIGANTSILVGEMSIILKQNGVEIGQNRLYQYLRDNGYVIKNKDERYNLPTQKSLNLGILEVKTTVVTKKGKDGNMIDFSNNTTKVTVKGQQYFINKFLKEKNNLLIG